MRCLPSLLLATQVLSGCASTTQDPSGIWINQAAIDEWPVYHKGPLHWRLQRN